MRRYFTARAVNVKKAARSIFKYAFAVLLLFCAQKLCFAEELKICFAGDLLLDRGVRQQINKKGADYLFSGVSKFFSGYDAVVVNLECPVTENSTPVNKKYIFRAEPEWLAALRKAGITHAALANNHTNDQGRNGIKDTIENLKENGIVPFGAGKNGQEAAAPALIEKGNVKAAIFNSVLVPLENWAYLGDSYGPCQKSADELCLAVRKLKENDKRCYVIVVLHWGVEYASSPDISQVYQARKLIDSGADAVIGHHPHVSQPVEIYKGKYIFYSLGNFVFDSKRPEAGKGVLAALVFTENGVEAREFSYEIRQCAPYLPDFK
jgi:poly-gamma-glutamate synthesis protein (capsule biosynthesis protein)